MAQPIKTCGMAAADKSGVFKPYVFEHRPLRDTLVHVEIDYAGVCHTDIHMCRADWLGDKTLFPMVPGHEIVGKVKGVGPGVTKFKVGDDVAVGCFVDSCGKCERCGKGEEQYCLNTCTQTYGDVHRHDDNSMTNGGYARDIVVRESFVLKMPKELVGKPGAAPLLCAGITIWSPIKHWKMDKPGTKIGLVGLGGLGHMLVKFAKALNIELTVFSRSNSKEAYAKKLGAKDFILTGDAEMMKKTEGTLDFIIDTVSAKKDMAPYLSALKPDGVLVVVGLPPITDTMDLHSLPLIFGRKSIAGSLVGGIAETQEMLEFCAKHNILCETEDIGMDDIHAVHQRVVKADVQFRFVFDIKKTCPKIEDVEKLPADKKVCGA